MIRNLNLTVFTRSRDTLKVLRQGPPTARFKRQPPLDSDAMREYAQCPTPPSNPKTRSNAWGGRAQRAHPAGNAGTMSSFAGTYIYPCSGISMILLSELRRVASPNGVGNQSSAISDRILTRLSWMASVTLRAAVLVRWAMWVPHRAVIDPAPSLARLYSHSGHRMERRPELEPACGGREQDRTTSGQPQVEPR